MRKLSLTSLALLLVAACGGNPLGKPCQVDNDCGPGFDCFPDVCVQVCTKADECPQGQTCYRYHCIVPGQEHAGRSRPPTPIGVPTPIPPPPGGPPPSTLSQAPGPGTAQALPPARVMATPPLPDTTAAELRAIRRELEVLATEQAKLTAAIEELRKSTKPEKPAAPAKEPAKKP